MSEPLVVESWLTTEKKQKTQVLRGVLSGGASGGEGSAHPKGSHCIKESGGPPMFDKKNYRAKIFIILDCQISGGAIISEK